MFKIKFGLVSLVFLVLVFPGLALAAGRENSKGIDKTEMKAEKLMTVTTARQRACLAREKAIQTRMNQLTRMATNMETVFTKIADKVKDYYQSRVVPAGKSVSNYAALVGEVESKKVAVEEAIKKSQSEVTSFNCINSDPKVMMNTFRTDMQLVKTALKNYRTSVSNLIVAVKIVAPTPAVTSTTKEQ